MQFPQTFVPVGSRVGVVPMITEFFLLVATFAFLAAFVFFLVSKNSVAPRHRAAAILSAVIMLVAGASYWIIRTYYHDLLHLIDATADPSARRKVMHDAFLAINQYRYADWAITTPLLLLNMVLMLRVRPREVLGPIAVLLAADFWMILAGFIGEQALDPRDGSVLAGHRFFWGGVSTMGYAGVVFVLFRFFWARYGGRQDDDTAAAFRLMILSTVTVWGVYPIGYMIPALFPKWDLNFVHIAFTLADVVNKVGLGVVGYMAGAHELEKRVPEEAMQSARMVA